MKNTVVSQFVYNGSDARPAHFETQEGKRGETRTGRNENGEGRGGGEGGG